MQDNNVLVTDHRYAHTARFWRESLSQVAGVYRIAPHGPGRQPARRLSRTVPLTRASVDVLRRIGDGELGEFAVAAAGIAFLLWKYFRIPVTVLARRASPRSRRRAPPPFR